MKNAFILLLILLSASAFGQKEEIYDLTFSDTANFSITTIKGLALSPTKYKTPKKIIILDTTLPFDPTNFWLDEPNFRSPEIIKAWRNDEHHPYNYSFLFKDTLLDKLIDDTEKIGLSKKAAASTSQKIHLKGAGYETVPYSDKLDGLFIVTSEPIFSSDQKYAFISLYFVFKNKKNDDFYDSAIMRIVYHKNENNIWQKLKTQSFMIL